MGGQGRALSRRGLRTLAVVAAPAAGLGTVAALVVVPAALLFSLDDRSLDRWSQVGQAFGGRRVQR